MGLEYLLENDYLHGYKQAVSRVSKISSVLVADSGLSGSINHSEKVICLMQTRTRASIVFRFQK